MSQSPSDDEHVDNVDGSDASSDNFFNDDDLGGGSTVRGSPSPLLPIEAAAARPKLVNPPKPVPVVKPPPSEKRESVEKHGGQIKLSAAFKVPTSKSKVGSKRPKSTGVDGTQKVRKTTHGDDAADNDTGSGYYVETGRHQFYEVPLGNVVRHHAGYPIGVDDAAHLGKMISSGGAKYWPSPDKIEAASIFALTGITTKANDGDDAPPSPRIVWYAVVGGEDDDARILRHVPKLVAQKLLECFRKDPDLIGSELFTTFLCDDNNEHAIIPKLCKPEWKKASSKDAPKSSAIRPAAKPRKPSVDGEAVQNIIVTESSDTVVGNEAEDNAISKGDKKLSTGPQSHESSSTEAAGDTFASIKAGDASTSLMCVTGSKCVGERLALSLPIDFPAWASSYEIKVTVS